MVIPDERLGKPDEEKTVSAILLCAGMGRRAKAFKPLLPWKDRTYLESVYHELVASRSFREIVVVTGFDAWRLTPVLEGLGARSVRNDAFEFGMHGSIRTGLEALEPGWEGALVAFVDQPQLQASDYRMIVDAFRGGESDLVRPRYQGASGNPAILGSRYLSEIQHEPNQDRGCAYLFQRHPQAVREVEMPTEACLCDFDFPPPPSGQRP